MIDLLCTKYLRVNVTLLAVKGIDTKLKENVRSSSQSICSASASSAISSTSTKSKSSIPKSPFKKSLRASTIKLLPKKDKVDTNDISAYATFSSTGILGIEEQNMLVSSNVVDESTNEIKKVIYWERENKIVHNDVGIEGRNDTEDENNEGSPTVSIPIVLVKNKSVRIHDDNEGKKKSKMLGSNLSEEVINIDLGLISSFNSQDNKMEKINLGRASFVISEEVCGSHTMSIPIRCTNNDIHCKKNTEQTSILKKLKNPSKNKVSFSSSSSITATSFRGDKSREFSLSPNAVLQLFVDISYADEMKVAQDEQLKSIVKSISASKSLIRSQKQSVQNSLMDKEVIVNEVEKKVNSNESSGLVIKPEVKKKRSPEQSWADAIFDKVMFKLMESCITVGSSCNELLCHEPNDDGIKEDNNTMTTAHDEETRTYFTEDETFFTDKKGDSRSIDDNTYDYTYNTHDRSTFETATIHTYDEQTLDTYESYKDNLDQRSDSNINKNTEEESVDARDGTSLELSIIVDDVINKENDVMSAFDESYPSKTTTTSTNTNAISKRLNELSKEDSEFMNTENVKFVSTTSSQRNSIHDDSSSCHIHISDTI